MTDFLAWIALRFEEVKRNATKRGKTLAAFDELHALYQQIDVYSREMFLAILQEAYDAEADRKMRRFILEYLVDILDEPNEFTTVTYASELTRRAQRLAEQITAAINRSLQEENRTDKNGVAIPAETELKTLLDREYNSLALLLDSYSIYTVDTGRMEAFKDDGITRVRWVTKMDGRECDYCRKLNGRVFGIHRVPTKPHPRCRCYLIRFD